MAPRVYATIGRAPDNDVVFDDPTVSNHHARLSWSGSSLLLEDLSSANGTFLDGQRVTTARTRPGADVQIGQVSLPWSHEGLRKLLKAGVGARTLVLPLQRSPSFVCGNCGHLGPLPAGPMPKAVTCPACKTTLRTETKPRGDRPGVGRGSWPLVLVLMPLLGAVAVLAVYRFVSERDLSLPAAKAVLEQIEQTPSALDAEQRIGRETAPNIASALTPMEATTRNSAVKIAARKEGPFHVEQVAEIWGAVRKQWRYVNDPEGREYFARASETIENGYVGDCDDFAITLASMVIAIGGKARVVLMDGPGGGHAYAEACVQGEPTKVAAVLQKHYRNRFRRYLEGAAPKTMAYRASSDCPIWLNLDWNANVPGGPYEPELWAVAVYEGGRTDTLAPANPVAGNDGKNAAPATHAHTPAP